ncbi:MAG: M28 family peptidase, partial [Chitinophagaceae bacterium]
MNQFLLFISLVFTLSVFGQKGQKPDAYAKTITAADLKKHLYIVAGAEMEGREATSEGERKAATYIENEFKRIGLQPGNKGSFRQYFPVYRDSLTRSVLRVGEQTFLTDKDFNANLNNITATQAFSEAVYMSPSVPIDSINKMELAGKLILTQGVAIGRSEALRSKGVAAVLTVSSIYPRAKPMSAAGSLTMQFFRKFLGAQQFTISEEVAKAIIGSGYDSVKAASMPLIVAANVQLEVQKTTSTLQSSNVLGMIPGKDLANEYLFITAHYDHEGKRGDSVIYYGADDDGSGTVSVIELAEAFAKAYREGRGPRRSIVFMTVSGEEKGLWGSAYYGANPIFPLAQTTADLNIDMIGRIDPKRKIGDSTNYVYVVGDDKLSSDLRTISETQNKKYTK